MALEYKQDHELKDITSNIQIKINTLYETFEVVDCIKLLKCLHNITFVSTACTHYEKHEVVDVWQC